MNVTEHTKTKNSEYLRLFIYVNVKEFRKYIPLKFLIYAYGYIYTRGSDDKMVLLLTVVMANLYILTHYNKIVL